MTEPLEGAMLPNAAAEAEAQRADEPASDGRVGGTFGSAYLPNAQPPPTWPDLAYWRDLANHREAMLAIRAGELDALRLELEMARKLIAEMRAPTDSTRAAVARAPFPARALRTFSTPEVWR